MICVSIGNRTYDQILEVLDNPKVEMAEIRLDLCPMEDPQISELFANAPIPLVATCRAGVLSSRGGIPAEEAWEKACAKLSVAINAGANYADLELEAPFLQSRRIQGLCQDSGTILIRSWHNYEETPDREYLEQIMDRCFRYGAQIAKLVSRASSSKDIEAMFSLYEKAPGALVAFCMGDKGQQSRIDCLAQGAPFTYAAPDDGTPVEPSQISLRLMNEAVFGVREAYDPGILDMPSSKSFAQRAIIAAALAEGTSHLGNYSPCDDSESAIKVALALGAEVRRDGRELTIKGIGGQWDCPKTIDTLNVGESGLLARLMIPLLACIGKGEVSLTGTGTLPSRPLSGASDIMAAFGVLLQNVDSASKAQHIPLRVKGKLIPGTADIPGQYGSQLISGLLMALPLCEGASTVYVNEPKSLPYMFITCDVLKRFGVVINSELEGDAQMIETQEWDQCSSVNFKIKGAQRYKAADFDLEGDWSAAANFMVAGAIFGRVQVHALDTSSLQADLGIVDILVDAGASVSELENGDICVHKGPLTAFEADLNNSPDLFPAVSILAAFCEGDSIIYGVKRLNGKESDRGRAIEQMLGSMGVECNLDGDVLCVHGESLASRIINGRLLDGGKYSSHHDHRIAMALKVASLGAKSPVEIDDEACVGKSFPDFFKIFQAGD